MRPSLVARLASLSTLPPDFFRRIVIASSMLPLDSVKAFWQSSKPAPVFSRSSLTIWDVTGLLMSKSRRLFLRSGDLLARSRFLLHDDRGIDVALDHGHHVGRQLNLRKVD